jgi:hypothetical protein
MKLCKCRQPSFPVTEASSPTLWVLQSAPRILREHQLDRSLSATSILAPLLGSCKKPGEDMLLGLRYLWFFKLARTT